MRQHHLKTLDSEFVRSEFDNSKLVKSAFNKTQQRDQVMSNPTRFCANLLSMSISLSASWLSRVLTLCFTAFAASCVSNDPRPFVDPDASSSDSATLPRDVIVIGDSSFPDRDDSGTCGGELKTGELVPLDMIIMLDSSGSMGDLVTSSDTKWKLVTSALGSFVGDPSVTNLRLALQFFPFLQPDVPDTCRTNAECKGFGPCVTPKICDNFFERQVIKECTTNAQCEEEPGGIRGNCLPRGVCERDTKRVCFPEYAAACADDLGDCNQLPNYCAKQQSCDAKDYAAPVVTMTPRAEAQPLITAKLASKRLAGATPTGPALQGAIDYLKGIASDNPDHHRAVLLVTDGEPTDCSPTQPDQIAQIAANAAPDILTYVIGVLSEETAVSGKKSLDRIAAAGKTEHSYIVKVGSNLAAEFANSLASIRKHRVDCDYTIPNPTEGTVQYNRVNVEVRRASESEQVVYVTNAANCGSGGWYYDPPLGTPGKSPQRIRLCAETCAAVQNQPDVAISIRLGCPTVVVR